MIYVSQGHEKGIGLEVFLKSFLLLNSDAQEYFHLYCTKSALKKNLEYLNIEYHFPRNGRLNLAGTNLQITYIDPGKSNPSKSCLDAILNEINEEDILFTLPTSKDELPSGHTEYFREKFSSPNLCMSFVGPSETMALLTDHIPLKKVTKKLSTSLIIEKVSSLIDYYIDIHSPFEEIFFSGINPHAGEGGILGKEEKVLTKAINKLKNQYPNQKFFGPLSADGIHYQKDSTKHQLFVYAYHDQGLTKFKSQNETLGVNQTLGLPFLRVSVDHGTAFELYGKNKANAMGCFYALNYALKRHQEHYE